jgi:hypothetical protein
MSRRRITAVFAGEGPLLDATRAARDQGCEIVDAYTPYAVHGLDKAMGLRPSRLSWVCFLCGATGALGILWFQYWTSATDWPLNIGGKPFDSLPAFIPITFEAAVLLAGLGVVAALFLRARLWPGRRPQLAAEAVTNDRFALVVRVGESMSVEETRALLGGYDPVALEDDVEEAA